MEWQTKDEDCQHDTLQRSEFKGIWSYQLGSVIGIYQLEYYFVSLLMWIALTKLTTSHDRAG